MFNLVIPVAGKGSRFDSDVPKPMIEIRNEGESMTQTLLDWSLDCLPLFMIKKIVLVTSQENDAQLREFYGDSYSDVNDEFTPIEYVVDENPKGQAASALVGLNAVPEQEPVIMANCDQWVRPVVGDWRELYDVLSGVANAAVPFFNGRGPKWSYVCLDSQKNVAYVVEKPKEEPPMGQAIVGIFAYRKAICAKNAINGMMRAKFTVNGEYYTAPSLNWNIAGSDFTVKPINCYMQGIGTPEDVAEFQEMDLDVFGQ